ncbi:MAG: metallophosphatase domain-containing protein [Parachlamydiaceae bacterium]|nr:metallophosphatase domain-containing protein [Parachlamydiaceae bacterium]
MTLVTCISDLHGYKPDLTPGDLLIIAGDLTARDTAEQYDEFNSWLNSLPFKCKVVIGGNHDVLLEELETKIEGPGVYYLQDTGCEFRGLKIWGTPWTHRFHGQNPQAMAFSVKSEFQLKDFFDLIPADTDILITHSPPLGILDECRNGRAGSEMLRQAVFRIKPQLCCFGHIHENGGKSVDIDGILFVNASVVNEFYQNVNQPFSVNF